MTDKDSFDARRLANNPIAIVGMAGLFPQAPTARDYWQNIIDGVDCSTEVPPDRWHIDDYYDPYPAAPDKTYSRRGAFIPDVEFSPLEFGLPPNQLEVTSNLQTLSLGVARDVLRDAGAPGSSWYDPSRTGVVLGVVSSVPLMHPLAARLSTPVLREVVRSCGLTDDAAQVISDKYVQAFAPWAENSFPGLLANVTAGRVANRLDLGGMNCTVDAACAASLSAVRMAVAELVDGRADMMITGGCDTDNSIFIYMCFSATGALSRSDRIRPFDASADGTLLGEGIGMLALKRLADARADGDRIYAVIRGIGSSSDGRARSIYAPRAEGQQLALRRAYADADCSPSSVELFEAHATGTAVGDRTEVSALLDVLSEAGGEPHVAAMGSVKSQIGHTKGAAGAASLMKLALSLYHKTLPPTIGVEQPNAAIDPINSPIYLNTVTRPWIRDPRRPTRRAAASAMGFGGTNFHVVLEEHGTDRREIRTLHSTARVQVWHAPDVPGLLARLRSTAPPDGTPIPAGSARIALVRTDEASAVELRAIAVSELAGRPDEEQWTHPRGVYFRRRALPAVAVGALFAGQGSQYLDMGRETALNNPVVAEAFDQANAHFVDADRRLGAVVFPPPTFDAELRRRQEAAVRRTEYAQPAIGALSVGQFRYLTALGLRCAAFLGHSFGELTALWAAGAVSDDDFFRLARARGRSMAPPSAGTDADDGHPESDQGSMAAVQGTPDQVEDLLRQVPDVVICNRNAPDQLVVGGDSAQVAALIEACGQAGINARALPVAAAFHTRFVDHALGLFRPAVAAATIGTPSGPVFANTAGASYGADVEANRRVLVDQLRHPVEFESGLRSMAEAGCTVLVEFGPKQVLTQLARRTLGESIVTIPVDSGPLGDGDVALKRAAAHLAVLGADIDVAALDVPAPDASRAPGASTRGGGTVTLSAAEYVPPARAAAYAAALTDGYRVLPATADPGPGPTAPGGSASGDDSSALPRPAVVAIPAQAAPAAVAERKAPDKPVVVAPAPAAVVGAASGPALAAGVEPGPDDPPVPTDDEDWLPPTRDADPPTDLRRIADVLHRQTDLHADYLDGQLRVVDGLMEALSRTSTAPDRLATVAELITSQTLAIGRTHTRANEVLAWLATRGGGTAPAPYRQGMPPDAARPGGDILAATNGRQHDGAASGLAPRSAADDDGPPGDEWAAPAFDDQAQRDGGGSSGAHVGAEAGSAPDAALPWSRPPIISSPFSPGAPSDAPGLGHAAGQADANGSAGGNGSSSPRASTGAANGHHPPAAIANTVARHTVLPTSTTGTTSTGVDATTLRSSLLTVIADRTGYTVDMIDPTMDLEADLGVDSIKRVQVLGAIQEQFPHLPQLGPETIAELRTINHIVNHLAHPDTTDTTTPTTPTANGNPQTTSGTEPPAWTSDAGIPAPAPPDATDEIPAADVPHHPLLLTRIPAIDLARTPYAAHPSVVVVEADSGVDGADAAPGPLSAALRDALRTAGWQVHRIVLPTEASDGWLDDASWDAAAVEDRLAGALPALPRVDACLVLLDDAGPLRRGVRWLATAVLVAKHLEPGLAATARAGTRGSFVTVTRIDGGLGLRGERGPEAAVLGGVGGVVKTLSREAPEVFCRAIDLAPALDAPAAAAAVLAELSDAARDVREVGLDAAGGRWTLGPGPRTPSPVFGTDGPAPTEIEIGADDVVVVTGGARGVTALCVQALAERGAAEFLLLGRSELAEEPPWAIGVDDADLQSATIAALSDGSRPPTPRAVNSLHRRLLAGREIRATLDRCATAGARARYLAVDITDPSAVRDTLAAERHRVTAVVHGAGALADALLPRKSAANVRDVLGPKLTGLASVLDALDGAPLRHIVLFCSVAGVFGNAGQADYAAANEALARWAASLRAADVVQPGVPRRRVTAIAWGAWDGGMVSPELRELFLARGVAPLRPAAATRAFVDQFTAARAEDGYVLLGPPTALKAPPNPATTAPIEALRDITALPAEPAVLAHRIGAHPVLPAAFAIGWMISTVERALPGLRVVECREFQVLNGIVFDGRPAAGHRVSVERGNADDGLLLRVAVRGEPVGRGAGAPPGDVTHYAATLRLTARDAAGPGPTAPGSPGSGGHAPLRSDLPLTDLGQGPENGLEIYTAGVQFHGPALQGMRRVLELGDDRFVVECRLGDLGVADGAYAGAFYSPVLADVVLQAPPVIGHRLLGAACLPLAVGRLELMRPLPDDQPFVVVVDDVRLGRNRVTVTATACDEEGNVMQRYTDVTVVSTPDLADRFAAAVATWQREARP